MVCIRAGIGEVLVADFKVSAWQSEERANAYHDSTVAAPSLFQLVRHDLYLRHVQRFAAPGAKILDLGCGSGLISVALHDLGYKVVSCDVSEAMLKRARANFGTRRIEMRQGSGFHIPAQDGEFDMVVSRMLMAHFPEWRMILREKARVVRPGGFVLFDFGNREHLADTRGRIGQNKEFPYDTDINNPAKFYAVASEDEMREAASECGMELVSVRPHGLLLHNFPFWQAVGSGGVDEFNAKLNNLLENEQARELLILMEESFVSHLPKQATYGNLVVLRRESARSPSVETGLDAAR